jgi:hypothetical protein
VFPRQQTQFSAATARTSIALAAVLAALLALAPARAHALSPGQARDVADRIAIAWKKQQQKRGSFLDPVAETETGGYGNVMLGYSLMRAGERRHDRKLVHAGVRGVTSGLYEPARFKGVFDQLSIALSYNYARSHLARDPAFARARPEWERYLRGIGRPAAEGVLQRCMLSPNCFHNHEAAEDLADLELLDTGLRSSDPAAKLADPEGLRRTLLLKIGGDLARSEGHAGRTSWEGIGRPLGMLSDSGQWANAYHALSTAMLAAIIERLGSRAPATTRPALRTTADTLSAFIAPDGDVAYFGRRQEQSWTLAATVYAGEAAAGLLPGRQAARRYVAMADSAFRRIERVHLKGRLALQPLPRPTASITQYPGGVDANVAVSTALTAFLLNQAGDAAAKAARVRAGRLPAERDGWFLQPDQSGFATVRQGDIWFAVHRRPITSDPRFDFGLASLKLRRRDGSWEDLIRPRPLTHGKAVNSAGPILTERGKRWVPWGESIVVRPGGVVDVRGGWRFLRGGTVGPWLRRGATFRFTPLDDGVTLTFPVKAGDNVRMTAYLPAESARQGPNWVGDHRSTASLSTKPSRVAVSPGTLASCCDAHLSTGTMALRVGSDGNVSYTITAGATPGGPHAAPVKTRAPGSHEEGGVSPGAVALVLAALLLVAALLRTRARQRRRERERERRRRNRLASRR